MSEFIGIFSAVIIFFIVIGFFFFSTVGFIKPTTLQTQLFGIHLTIFGGFILLNDLSATGLVIMLLGLGLGVYGSFKENPQNSMFNQTDKDKNN